MNEQDEVLEALARILYATGAEELSAARENAWRLFDRLERVKEAQAERLEDLEEAEYRYYEARGMVR